MIPGSRWSISPTLKAWTAAAATPAIATSCAAIAGYDRSPGALAIRAADAAADPVAAAHRIAEHFELGIDAEAIGGVVAELAEEGVVAAAPEAANSLARSRSQSPRPWAEGALAAYINYFDTGSLTPINWARELFFHGDRPGRAGKLDHRHQPAAPAA